MHPDKQKKRNNKQAKANVTSATVNSRIPGTFPLVGNCTGYLIG